MKKIIPIIALCALATGAKAQIAACSGGFWSTPGCPSQAPTLTDSWVYIGNTNPTMNIVPVGSPIPQMPSLTIETGPGESDVSPSLRIMNSRKPTDQIDDYVAQVKLGSTAYGPQFWKDVFVIDGNGKTHIGISPTAHTTPNGFSLYVGQGILTERVKVARVNSGDWPDYVFANDYNLMPLSQLETYVDENKHLPDVPSAQDVEKDGIDLAEMDARLLRKIEELTLYVLDLKKANDDLRKQVAELKK